jgi:CDP-diacylglycerol--glycerol-3-phosphate 3-phosphatidyltransferase
MSNNYLWALILFTVASLTDHYDGKIARKNNQITNFGKFMDPLADKILVVSAFICFVQFRWAPAWVVILIVAREFMVTALRLIAMEGGVVIAANKWGKTKTVSQITAIFMVLAMQYAQSLISAGRLRAFTLFGADSGRVFSAAGGIFIYISAFFTVLSGVIYIVKNINLINTTK